MGEYATYQGQDIKIGTCEDMYYLRADQAELVQPKHGSVNPIRDAAEIRFRFPFPDEDGIEPGDFENHAKTVTAWGCKAPEGVEHGSVQFKADNGYLVSLPCPESAEAAHFPYTIHRNGYGGAVKIAQQRVWNGCLVLVCECGGCGRAWRLPELEDAQPVIDSLRSEDPARHQVADRIEAGYVDPPAWVSRVLAAK